MSFVQDKNNRIWSMSRLIQYSRRRLESGEFVVMARFDGHNPDVVIDDIHMSHALNRPRSAFAAARGTKVLVGSPVGSDEVELQGDGWLWDHEVIGWALSFDGATLPVTVEGVLDDYVAIEHPSGRIESYEVDCSDRSKLLEYLRSEELKRRAHAATEGADRQEEGEK